MSYVICSMFKCAFNSEGLARYECKSPTRHYDCDKGLTCYAPQDHKGTYNATLCNNVKCKFNAERHCKTNPTFREQEGKISCTDFKETE